MFEALQQLDILTPVDCWSVDAKSKTPKLQTNSHARNVTTWTMYRKHCLKNMNMNMIKK